MSAIIRSTAVAEFDVQRYRADFPALQRQVHGKPLVYFDNANTAQKPLGVIEAVDGYYRRHNANVSRAVHTLGSEATALYEATRDKLRAFINAPSRDEVIFTRGTTESINLVAYSWALPRLQPGDEILLTQMEHHANIVPWQLVCERTGAKIKVAPISASGELLLDQLDALLTPHVKLLALTHVSNVLGTVNPIARITAMARARGIPVLVDGSQAAPHLRIDVQALGCDFYAITGHKMFGPTGTGMLWAKRAILDSMPPFMGGGEMIKQVTFDKTIFNELPYKFEAGTPNIAGVIGLGAAIDYINALGIETIRAVENDLLGYATEQLNTIPGMRIFGTAPGKAAVISFLIEGVHAHDLATILDTDGVAVRSGHHCAHPLMQFFGVAATARASLAFYNTRDEIDIFITALLRARNMLL
ncbi:cysteine desulfurase [Pseudolysobacter antarcticus]|uniref:Cysteine desulfurase n=1 Tax=Pseudolysobacter antarcticus TaxID=2511995 RepID=A0A411HGV0_9GAMM|nr:cysteine desulfurase [Pseudolysobacter antarcticus]QBB69667.1 cysteine desulfurase [Pseudolysobacter antarcticus]